MLKYNPDIHIDLLDKTLADGLSGVAAFCAKADISINTFYTWLDTYPDFYETYDRVLAKAQRKWENLPIENPNISFPYWRLIYQNRFNLGRKNVNIAGKKAYEKIKQYDKAYSDGKMTHSEYSAMVKSALDEVSRPIQEGEDSTLSDFFAQNGFDPEEFTLFRENMAKKSQEIALEVAREIVEKRSNASNTVANLNE